AGREQEALVPEGARHDGLPPEQMAMRPLRLRPHEAIPLGGRTRELLNVQGHRAAHSRVVRWTYKRYSVGMVWRATSFSWRTSKARLQPRKRASSAVRAGGVVVFGPKRPRIQHASTWRGRVQGSDVNR